MKAADSLIIFPTTVREARSIQAKCSTGVKNSSSNRSNCKIQKLRPDGKQLTESQKINGYSGSPRSLIQADDGQNSELIYFFSFHSELLCSAENVWRQNAILSVSTGVYIYIKLKFRHSRGIISNQKSIVSDWQLEFVNQCDNHLELLPSDTWGVHLELLRVH